MFIGVVFFYCFLLSPKLTKIGCVEGTQLVTNICRTCTRLSHSVWSNVRRTCTHLSHSVWSIVKIWMFVDMWVQDVWVCVTCVCLCMTVLCVYFEDGEPTTSAAMAKAGARWLLERARHAVCCCCGAVACGGLRLLLGDAAAADHAAWCHCCCAAAELPALCSAETCTWCAAARDVAFGVCATCAILLRGNRKPCWHRSAWASCKTAVTAHGDSIASCSFRLYILWGDSLSKLSLLSFWAVPQWSLEAFPCNYNVQVGDDGGRILLFLLDCMFCLCAPKVLFGMVLVFARILGLQKLFQKSVLHDCISMCFDICTINIRVSIGVRGLHLVLCLNPHVLLLQSASWLMIFSADMYDGWWFNPHVGWWKSSNFGYILQLKSYCIFNSLRIWYFLPKLYCFSNSLQHFEFSLSLKRC